MFASSFLPLFLFSASLFLTFSLSLFLFFSCSLFLILLFNFSLFFPLFFLTMHLQFIVWLKQGNLMHTQPPYILFSLTAYEKVSDQGQVWVRTEALNFLNIWEILCPHMSCFQVHITLFWRANKTEQELVCDNQIFPCQGCHCHLSTTQYTGVIEVAVLSLLLFLSKTNFSPSFE